MPDIGTIIGGWCYMGGVGLALLAIVTGIAVALLVIGRRGSTVIEMSQHDEWLHKQLAQPQRRDPPGQDGPVSRGA